MKTFFGEHHDFGTEFIGMIEGSAIFVCRTKRGHGLTKNPGLKKHCASCVALYMIYKSALRKLRCASLISETRCALLISKTSCALLIYGKMPIAHLCLNDTFRANNSRNVSKQKARPLSASPTLPVVQVFYKAQSE